MQPLTKRQRQVLNAITPGISLRELMKIFGWASINACKWHLHELRRKGYVTWTPGKSRTLVRLDRGIPVEGVIS